MTWGQNEWLWLGGLLVGCVITWYFSRLYGNRRKKLLVSWDATPLVPDSKVTRGVLEIRFENQIVEDPHLLKIVVKNVGPADITSADFDSQRPLGIDISTGYLDTLDETYDRVEAGIEPYDPMTLTVSPVLIPRGGGLKMDVLVDGHPSVKVRSPLINTEIVDSEPGQRTLFFVNELAEVAPGGQLARIFLKRPSGSRIL